MNTLRLFLFSPVGQILLRWTVLLAFAWVASAAMYRSHPRRRLVLWRGVLVLSCLLPFGSIIPKKVFQLDGNPKLLQSLSHKDPPDSPTVDSRLVTSVSAAPATLQLIRDYFTEKFVFVSIAYIWLIGVAIGALRLFVLRSRLSRLLRTARNPNAELFGRASEVQFRLGIRRPAAVRVSDDVNSPLVTGLLDATILLPAKWQQSLEPIQAEVLLSHEVAHLRSYDLVWCAGWRWMKVFGWFHPLIWKVPSAHDLACEQEADRIASGQFVTDGLYTRLLAQLTLRVMRLPAVEATLAMNSTSQIVKRLAFLRRGGFGHWRWGDAFSSFGLVVGLALFTMGWGLSFASAEHSSNGRIVKGIKSNTQDPARESPLRRYIAGLVEGRPDRPDMGPGLLAASDKQWPEIQRKFGGAGALKSLVFKEVNDLGWDVYIATFEHRKAIFLIGPLNAEHKMETLLIRPVPDAATLERIKSNTRDPARESPLRRYIAGLVEGRADRADMGPGLLAASDKQWPEIQRRFGGAGALKSLVFKKVNDLGWDVYIATFEHRKAKFLIGPLNEENKMSGLLIGDPRFGDSP